MSKRFAIPVRGLLLLGVCVVVNTSPAAAQSRPRPPVVINPSTPLQELLPEPPEATVQPLPWRVKDLAQAPEIFFQKVRRESYPKDFDTLSLRDKQDFFRKTVTASELDVARQIAKIHHLDKAEPD